MAKSFVIFLLCLSSVYADTEMKMDMAKDVMSDKMEPMMVETVMSKLKRDSWPVHSTPCPPSWPHYHKGWAPEHPKVQFVHQPHYEHKPVVVVKPHAPSYQSGWQSPDPWQQNSGYNKYGWNKPSHGWQSPGWQSGWNAPSYPSHGWQQPKVIVQKPVHSYAPQYHKPAYHVPSYHHNVIKPAVVVKPDCPPYQHQHQPHQHTGIVYAPQHQYHHQQPQIVKVVKPAYHQPAPVHHQPAPVYHQPAPVYHQPAPVYHQPAPVYHQPAPVYHKPAPVYHHPAPVYHHPAPSYHHPSPVHVPKVEICDK